MLISHCNHHFPLDLCSQITSSSAVLFHDSSLFILFLRIYLLKTFKQLDVLNNSVDRWSDCEQWTTVYSVIIILWWTNKFILVLNNDGIVGLSLWFYSDPHAFYFPIKICFPHNRSPINHQPIEDLYIGIFICNALLFYTRRFVWPKIQLFDRMKRRWAIHLCRN